MMDLKWKAKWIAALRSGDYEQCTGRLHLKDDGFCCLGVLCDIFNKGAWVDPTIEKPDNMVYAKKKTGDCGNVDVLPVFVYEDVALSTNNPLVKMYVGEETLAELNDAGLTFADIADIIEEQL